MAIFHKVDVSKEWNSGMTTYGYPEGSEKEGSSEHFAKYCILPNLEKHPKHMAILFDFSNMTFSASTQMLYIIAYYLVREAGLKSREIVNRVVIYDDSDPVMSNIFIRAVFEATGEIPVVVGE